MSSSRHGSCQGILGWFQGLCLTAAILGGVHDACGQVKYQNADEAFSVGAAFYNSRNFTASREPFEAALTLAPNDTFRVKIYEALIPAYREVPDNEKMFTAIDFIITKSEQPAKQSLARRSLLAFIQNRGLVDVAIARYEKMLEKNPQDRTSLFILSDVYADLKKDPKRVVQRSAIVLAPTRVPSACG